MQTAVTSIRRVHVYFYNSLILNLIFLIVREQLPALFPELPISYSTSSVTELKNPIGSFCPASRSGTLTGAWGQHASMRVKQDGKMW